MDTNDTNANNTNAFKLVLFVSLARISILASRLDFEDNQIWCRRFFKTRYDRVRNNMRLFVRE